MKMKATVAMAILVVIGGAALLLLHGSGLRSKLEWLDGRPQLTLVHTNNVGGHILPCPT